MPELPEVETVCRGLAPLLMGAQIRQVVVRNAALRWPVAVALLQERLSGATVLGVGRRGKYILLQLSSGTVIIHLGMTGRLFVAESSAESSKHEHLLLHFDRGDSLRYVDARRFGAWLWGGEEPLRHPLLATLGPEPLTEALQGETLWRQAQGKRVAVKVWLMDNRVVVGVGNIYAAEVLFRVGLHPLLPVASLTLEQCHRLVVVIREVLTEAIRQGGTTVRDYRHVDGTHGFFQTLLHVYGRQGEPCHQCGALIQALRLGGRSSCFCPVCQAR
ncbi:MAG: bifunctional DNA-formamidopyrimidine glycosylase/DNA-(apurinic or apyrimidinic site) lyase [Magnetococcales bacterium]|nr:bifunctional DNA-formamidopyrimidine glycosylase/DNA-(apurinic or apyrimidinic site) lyase [Magnetococcales bacterium]MBF0114392.1 bifunctional DNA-formamidopyrimidine glycosylase/DNA-(apurinic or apyrimidinic site) lyase [Magnetococcales bacterium]